jgi:hypothetical protein
LPCSWIEAARKIEDAGMVENTHAVLPPLLAETSSYVDMDRIHKDSVEIEEMLGCQASTAVAVLVNYSCLPMTMAFEEKVQIEDIHTC